jgi:hypothetical protein
VQRRIGNVTRTIGRVTRPVDRVTFPVGNCSRRRGRGTRTIGHGTFPIVRDKFLLCRATCTRGERRRPTLRDEPGRRSMNSPKPAVNRVVRHVPRGSTRLWRRKKRRGETCAAGGCYLVWKSR